MRFKVFSEKHPVLAAMAAVAIATLVTELPLKAFLEPALGPAYAEYGIGAFEQFFATFLVVLAAWSFGLKNSLGFRLPYSAKLCLLGWPLALFALLNASDYLFGTLHIVFDPGLTAALILLYLSTGFIEEGLFRGLLLGLFRRRWGEERRGILKAVLLSSLLFSLLHLVNFAMGRYTLLAALSQIGFAFSFGVFFAALYIRTNSLWPGIILHMLVDFAGNIESLAPGALPHHERLLSKSPQEALVAVLICLPLLLIGLFYLRKPLKPSNLMDGGPFLLFPFEPGGAPGLY